MQADCGWLAGGAGLRLDPDMLESLQLWIDEEPRDGPTNMAVDEWLLGSVREPLLRIYRWQPGWGSFGYFVARAEARSALPGLQLVRRWSGGGIVDHRNDWTYTLVAPRGGELADARGPSSYATIHTALARALAAEAMEVHLAAAGTPTRGGECFREAAEFDVLGAGGAKVAGAGQRRTARGLLHQGSVAVPGSPERGRRLAASLARGVVEVCPVPTREMLEASVALRYGSKDWMARR